LGSGNYGIDRFVVAEFGGGWPFEYWVVMVFGFCGWQQDGGFTKIAGNFFSFFFVLT
jgi:hypothetical protein